jgi:hypothetical protein
MVHRDSVTEDSPIRREVVLACRQVADVVGFVRSCPGMVGIPHDSAEPA